ncbi:MAG: Nucleoside diphosphate kinase [candidate division WS6 bacterium OLB20]|uniref:nucleoside-diphosphate kinase n=1 Tax=candidate division WS6 bacterium OLB20 TaxID=1617426 RepID=A0A136LYL7_9BACT|nr:MAG: Nucleoside diphosphate kinase [candidate division WS6 bacterium OLB20]
MSNTEKTVIIVKHDGVARGLMGQIIKRFERVGLKLVALEFLQSTEDMGKAHYPDAESWYRKVGERTLSEYKEKGIDAVKELGTDDAIEIGKLVKQWNVDYLTYGPVLAMVWEGPNAVKIGRKLVGETNPINAAPGTIRGDFSSDNAELANQHKRPFYNLVHASGEVAEAEDEIALWFEHVEVIDYSTYAAPLMGMQGKLTRK